MEVRIRHGKGKQSVAFSRFHRVVCDQPFDENGSDSGMTPPELMLSALGCCAMHYAIEYLGARHLPLDRIELKVTAEKTRQPARLAEITISIDAPGLTNRIREGLIKAVESCLLHRTLCDSPRVKIAMAEEVAPQPVSSVS